MSILLDALKKSEEQRRLGGAPDIHSPGAGPADADRGPQWIPLTLTALSVIVMFWFGWQQFRPPETGLPAPGPQVATSPDPGGEATASTAGELTGTPGPAAAGTTAGEPAPGDAPSPKRTLVEAFSTRKKSLQGLTIMPPKAARPGDQHKPELSRSVSDYQAPATEPPPAAPSAEPDSGQQAAPPPASAPAARAPHVPEPISYWELPQGVRDSLPDLHISVLVYAEDPADRFVLVDGRRLGEKQQLDGGVELEEIRRDGGVFLYRKYRFLVEGQ